MSFPEPIVDKTELAGKQAQAFRTELEPHGLNPLPGA